MNTIVKIPFPARRNSILSILLLLTSLQHGLAQGWIPEEETTVDFISYSTPTVFGEIAYYSAPGRPAATVQLRPSSSLRGKMPPVGDQKKTNSCVAWTCGYSLMSYLCSNPDVIDPPATSPRDPMFMHHWLVQLGHRNKPELEDKGARFSSAFAVINSRGAINLGMQQDFTVHPALSILNQALAYQLPIAPKRVGIENILLDVKKSLLIDQSPVPCGFYVDQNFINGGGFTMKELTTEQGDKRNVPVWTRNAAANLTRHAMLIIGYNDTIDAFEVMNSWGTGWGDSGYIWVDYKFFADQGTDPETREDNPCCVSAYTYVIDDMDYEGSGWVRVLDASSQSNFNDIKQPQDITPQKTLVVAPVDNLNLRKELRGEKNPDGTISLTAAHVISKLKPGDRFKVTDLKRVALSPTRIEYWAKGNKVP